MIVERVSKKKRLFDRFRRNKMHLEWKLLIKRNARPEPCLFGSRDERTESADATKTNRVRLYPSGERHEILG